MRSKGIQPTIMLVFSIISISMIMILGVVMYINFSNFSTDEYVRNSQKVMSQSGAKLEDYLDGMRKISSAVYYNVINGGDFDSQNSDIQTGMNYLYEANKDNLRSAAIYDGNGNLMAAEPVSSQKPGVNVAEQEWYKQAMGEVENLHFSVPHIQNLFDDGTYHYYKVISLSRAVELTKDGQSQMGVLLVDMDYSGISRMMKQINSANNGQYYYLCDSNGEIIYHPKQIQILDGICKESNEKAAGYKDGIHDEKFEGKDRKVIVKSISYTGWKLVCVIEKDTLTHGMIDIKYFLAVMIALMAMMLVLINRLVSVRISRPILKLNESVMKYDAGQVPDIYIGGPSEIRYLGHSIKNSYEKIDRLMDEVVEEQTERRKRELEALQSQINPHFLYNTLESITWMIEGEQNDQAVFVISQLAKLFRISLSKGHTIISIRDEIQHAKSYMNIQKIRYKDSFSAEFDIDEEVYSCCIVKLILQPILENAINYGIVGMEDCGEIKVTGKKDGENIVLSVADNGIGMNEEQVKYLLTDSNKKTRHGSGVGLVNVNNRIHLLFGNEYGITVWSEPDEGTIISVTIPAVEYNEENRKKYESGYRYRKDKKDKAAKDEE